MTSSTSQCTRRQDAQREGQRKPAPSSTAGAKALTKDNPRTHKSAAAAGNCSKERVNKKARVSRGAGQGPFAAGGMPAAGDAEKKAVIDIDVVAVRPRRDKTRQDKTRRAARRSTKTRTLEHCRRESAHQRQSAHPQVSCHSRQLLEGARQQKGQGVERGRPGPLRRRRHARSRRCRNKSRSRRRRSRSAPDDETRQDKTRQDKTRRAARRPTKTRTLEHCRRESAHQRQSAHPQVSCHRRQLLEGARQQKGQGVKWGQPRPLRRRRHTRSRRCRKKVLEENQKHKATDAAILEQER